MPQTVMLTLQEAREGKSVEVVIVQGRRLVGPLLPKVLLLDSTPAPSQG